MKKIYLLFVLFLVASCTVDTAKQNSKVVVAYVSYQNPSLPDVEMVTHINYAFGLVRETFDGVDVVNLEHFERVVALKEQNPSLKIMLSIGGWGHGNFSEMAANDAWRKSFVESCVWWCDRYGLDGIDIDWEYPSSDEAGISAHPDDIENFTVLIRELRESLGADRLLTLATIADAKYVDFIAIRDYVDFINVMAYDVCRPPMHHSCLYRSSLSGRITDDEAMQAHIAAGVPREKLVLGVPFYGHGIDAIPDFADYYLIDTLSGYNICRNDTSRVPYFTDETGKIVLCYDDSVSIVEKCRYVQENDFRGIMYWEVKCDAPSRKLAKAVANEMIDNYKNN